jgi:glycosyltransferase involved in cell wall biosynthesis
VRIALICSDYPPLRTSAAVQIRDLAAEFLAQGHDPVVLVPAEDQAEPWREDSFAGVTVLRLAAPAVRAPGYVRRTLAEMYLPFAMIRALRRSPWRDARWDAIAWYSPTTFFGPLIWWLKRRARCPAYLILRDIFPEWALDLGLLRKGPVYWFFKGVANFQYAMADVIGVQTPSNLPYMARWSGRGGRRLEVLQNWLSPAADVGSSIRIEQTALAGRRVFVYIGNMGVAQGMDIFIDLAGRLRERADLGFLFVGRGTDVPRLRELARTRGLDNVVFHDEVDTREMPGLLAQCQVGLLALDPKHRTHNIPGKFLTYLQAGLPVLARVNPGTDVANLIESERVGAAYVGDSVEEFAARAARLMDDAAARAAMGQQGQALARRLFSPASAVRQIVAAVSKGGRRAKQARSIAGSPT